MYADIFLRSVAVRGTVPPSLYLFIRLTLLIPLVMMVESIPLKTNEVFVVIPAVTGGPSWHRAQLAAIYAALPATASPVLDCACTWFCRPKPKVANSRIETRNRLSVDKT